MISNLEERLILCCERFRRSLRIWAVALVGLVTGCIPLRQQVLVSGPAYPPVLLTDDRCLLVGIDVKREQIVAELSRVTDPNGKRYGVQVEPHQFDIDQNSGGVRADVYPSAADGSRLRSWANGVWSFHFVVKSNGVDQVIDQKWKYWTFYYNPLIHGPPN